jgi:enamine deaminase RidA (YjgF/YER057c/UK114 family)
LIFRNLKDSLVIHQLTTTLKTLGYDPQNLPAAGGNYLSVRQSGKQLYVAIQFPILGSVYHFQGCLGKELTTAQGYAAARRCATNALFQIEKYVGLSQLAALNHMDFYYRAKADWDDAPIVANGASDLFVEVLQDIGQHSRAIIGVAQLPRNFAVGLTVVATVR